MIRRFIDWVQYVSTSPMTEVDPLDEILAVFLEFFVIGIILLIGRVTYQLEIWYEKHKKDK